MWLLKLHFAISVICMLGYIGILSTFKERLLRFKRKGKTGKSKKRYSLHVASFYPLINLLIFALLVFMVICDDDAVAFILDKMEV